MHLLILCVPSLHQVVGNFHSLGKETYLTVKQVYEMVKYVEPSLCLIEIIIRPNIKELRF